ncbi:MAG TPA: NERD nuclease, partial [Bacillus bacterium]|nr:NERD nuclease [Bacillus sp. (in: firmicutes)]
IEDFLARYKKEILSGKEHKKLSKLLAKNDVPIGSHLDQFKIDPSQYLTGVQCPTCSLYAMERYSGTWNCKHCDTISKDAHKQALEDYFLLISPTITNKQFRVLTHIDSPKLATKLLVNLNLPSQGTTKNRIYTST